MYKQEMLDTVHALGKQKGLHEGGLFIWVEVKIEDYANSKKFISKIKYMHATNF